MESNLTRARSISIQRSASVASTVDDRQRSPRSPNLKGNSWAISAAKLRQSNFGNHSRVLSETSVRPTFNKKNDRDQIRIASAMGSSVLSRTGIDSPDYSDDHSPVYRGGARILEPLREDELMGDTSSRGSPSYEKGSRTASALSKPRSSIQLSELRDQVQDLKGKITSLKNRTRRESMQRRSLQMLKSPSPFTDAESWSSPGPYMQHSPSPSHSLERSDETRSTPTINKTKGSPKVLDPTPEIEPEEEKVDDDVMVDDYYDSQSRTQSRLDTGLAIMEEEPIPEENPLSQHQYAEKTTWSPHSQVAEILNADEEFGDSIISSTNSTSSFDLESSELIDEPELPPLQSHEDRPDAFDYEHFVLNSAMGSFSRQGKRPSRSHSPSSSSDCSASTTSTTRPFYNTGDNFDMSTDSLPYSSPNGSPTFKSLRPENVRMHSEDGYGDNKRPNHSRQTSTDSVSTVATFATAISGNDPSSRNQSRAQSRTQSRQAGATKNGYLAPSRPVVPITSFSRPRPPSVLFPSLSEGSINKEPVQPSVKARNGILSLLLSVDGEREGQDDNVLRSLLPEDKALLRSVVEELQSAVGRLMGRGEGSDGARSMLEGVRRELSSGGHGDVHGL